MSLKDRFTFSDIQTLEIDVEMPKDEITSTFGDESSVLKSKLKDVISQKISSFNDWLKLSIAEQKKFVRGLVESNLQEEFSSLLLSEDEKEAIAREFSKETVFGPLSVLYRDSSISEIFVNGAKNVYVEKNGKPYKTSVAFRDNEHLKKTIDAILDTTDVRLSEKRPQIQVRLADGSRVSATTRPLSVNGCTFSIKRYCLDFTTMEALLDAGFMTTEIARFLEGALRAKANILISGLPSSGKTSLLNAFIGLIPPSERTSVIENFCELNVPQGNILRFEANDAETIKTAIKSSCQMRPERLILDSLTGDEAKEFLNRARFECKGSIATIDASSAIDAVDKLEEIIQGENAKEKISKSLNFVVHLEKMPDGSRKIVQVSEFCGVKDNDILLKEIFGWEKVHEGINAIIGTHTSCSNVPNFLEKIAQKGMEISPKIFEAKYEHTYTQKLNVKDGAINEEEDKHEVKKGLSLNVDLLKKLKK